MTGARRLRRARLGLAAILAFGALFGTTTFSSASPSKQQVEAAKARLEQLNQQLSLLVEQWDQAQIKLQQVQTSLNETRAEAEQAQAEAKRGLAPPNTPPARADEGWGRPGAT